MLIVPLPHHIQAQRCFVFVMPLKMIGLDLNMEEHHLLLVILTCYHMEEGKVQSSINGSQDVLLPTPIGHMANLTICIIVKIGHQCMHPVAYGMTFLDHQLSAAVSTTQL